jgi:hypothetical protein
MRLVVDVMFNTLVEMLAEFRALLAEEVRMVVLSLRSGLFQQYLLPVQEQLCLPQFLLCMMVLLAEATN